MELLLRGWRLQGSLVYGKMMLCHTYAENPVSIGVIFLHIGTTLWVNHHQMWTDYPEVTTVSHSYAVSRGTNYIDFTVDKDSQIRGRCLGNDFNGRRNFESKYTDSQRIVDYRLLLTKLEKY